MLAVGSLMLAACASVIPYFLGVLGGSGKSDSSGVNDGFMENTDVKCKNPSGCPSTNHSASNGSEESSGKIVETVTNDRFTGSTSPTMATLTSSLQPTLSPPSKPQPVLEMPPADLEGQCSPSNFPVAWLFVVI